MKSPKRILEVQRRYVKLNKELDSSENSDPHVELYLKMNTELQIRWMNSLESVIESK